MADERKTQVTYQGNGTQRVYSFSFDYLRKAFVKVRLIDNEARKELVQGTEYTVTDKQITLASPTNLKIEIVRQTTTQPLVAWKDASVLKAVDMSVQEVQLLHLAEETRDEVRDGGMALSDAAQAWDARMHRIINLLDPQDPTDAVTLHYITANKESFLNELKAKGQEQVQGITQTGNTYLNRLNALKQAGEASASSAAHASLQAVNAQNKAKDWAISTDSPDGQTDIESSTGKTQSSRSWALIAKDLWSQCVSVLNKVNTYMQTVLSKAEEATIAAQQAFQAQVGAKQQATKATTQATQAEQSAQAAAKSAQQAATWNPAAYDTRQVSEQKYAKKEETLAAATNNGGLSDCLLASLDDPYNPLNQPHLIDGNTQINMPPNVSWGIRQVFYVSNKCITVQVVGVNNAKNQTVIWYNTYNNGGWTGWVQNPIIGENGHLYFPNGEMWIE